MKETPEEGARIVKHCKMCRINIIRVADSTSGLVPPPLYMVTRPRALHCVKVSCLTLRKV